MRLEKIILVLLASLLLTNCANRSHTGAVLGSTTTTGTCVSMGVENPYAIASCAMIGAFAGADVRKDCYVLCVRNSIAALPKAP